MQKKYSSESNPHDDSVILTKEDLNSPESIKLWIKDKLGLEQKFDSKTIASAVDGIIRDPKFLTNSEESKTFFIAEINNLLKKLEVLKK
jgi:hypothetical protein